MVDSGLIDKWMKIYVPKPKRCLSPPNQHTNKKNGDRQPSQPPRLSLNNFAGIFLVLLFGYVISILAFITEQAINLFI